MSLIAYREKESFEAFVKEKLAEKSGGFEIATEFSSRWIAFAQKPSDEPLAVLAHTVVIESAGGTPEAKRHFLSMISAPMRNQELGWLVIDGSPSSSAHSGETWQAGGHFDEKSILGYMERALVSLEKKIGKISPSARIEMVESMKLSHGRISSLTPLANGRHLTPCDFWKSFMLRKDPEATGCEHVRAFGTFLGIDKIRSLMEEQRRAWGECCDLYAKPLVESPYKNQPEYVRRVMEKMDIALAPGLASKKPVLLRGKPQDGKTHTARLYGNVNYGKDNVYMASFNDSTTVDSAIGGFRPAIGRAGGMEVRWVDGPIAAAFRSAQEGRKTLLILDEVFRAPAKARNFLINLLTYDHISNSYAVALDAAVKSGAHWRQEVLVAPADKLAILGTTNADINSQIDWGDDAERSRFPVVIDFNVTQADLFANIDALYAQHRFTPEAIRALKEYLTKVEQLSKDSALDGEAAIMKIGMRVACSYLDTAYENAKLAQDHPDNYLGIVVQMGIPAIAGVDQRGYAAPEQTNALKLAFDQTIGRLHKQAALSWPQVQAVEQERAEANTAQATPKPTARTKADPLNLPKRPRARGVVLPVLHNPASAGVDPSESAAVTPSR